MDSFPKRARAWRKPSHCQGLRQAQDSQCGWVKPSSHLRVSGVEPAHPQAGPSLSHADQLLLDGDRLAEFGVGDEAWMLVRKEGSSAEFVGELTGSSSLFRG